jgi:hypothetical protein
MPTTDAYSSSGHFGCATPPSWYKLVLIYPIFEGQIYADALDKWLNLLEEYFFVHNFSNRENIIFVLLKVVPHVKDWWDTYYEKKAIEESTLFAVVPTSGSFMDTIKEQYYPIGSCND